MSSPIRLGVIGEPWFGRSLVRVELLDEDGRRAIVHVWATSAGEACMNAEDVADERLGGDWAMNDWCPA